MTKATLVILLLICSHIVCAQEYYVLQVRGKVTFQKTGMLLKMNDVVKQSDKLVFSTESDAVAVVNAKSGRFIIKPKVSEGSSELMAIVKDILLPGTSRLSTRSGNFNNAHDIQVYFKDSVVLLSELKYKVSAAAFPMGANAFFFIRYRFNNEDINKKLVNVSDSLIIKRAELFAVDGKPIALSAASDLRLFYSKDKAITQVTNLSISTPDLTRLKAEIDILVKNMPPNTSASKLKEEVAEYLEDCYGKVSVVDFEKWYKSKQ
ncbi:MAG: hypothetical protein HOP08_16060 [Cyclobacteriaceae bacterium]|nr:hypothetical protein [Cyclobacteriaceae bacterium]